MKRRQKAGFLSPRSSKSTVTKEKERRKRKSEEKERRREEEKSNSCTLSFIIATLEIWRVFRRKKPLDAKGPFGDNVVKNPAAVVKMTSKVQPGRRLLNRCPRKPGEKVGLFW